MLVAVDKNNEDAGKPVKPLITEGPLCEKDEQANAMERARKLGNEALAEWRRLKEKIKEKIKN